jgi:Fe2+ transport system protein FeoA
MCGMEFERTNSKCEHGCPITKHCNLLRCPSCGYEFPGDSKAASWFGRVFGRQRRHRRRTRRRRRNQAAVVAENGNVVSLEDLGPGESAEMIRLACISSRQRNTLTVFGMTPGTEITLLQRRPTYVVRVGETELGIEEELAREIHVKRL